MIFKFKIILSVVVIFLFLSGPVYSRGPWETNGIWKKSASDNTNTESPAYNNSNNSRWNSSASGNETRTIKSTDYNKNTEKSPASNNANTGGSTTYNSNRIWSNSAPDNVNTVESTDNSNTGTWASPVSDIQSTGNLLRTPPGGPGDQPPGGTVTPIGEGLVILCLLCGGYFILKRRNPKKIE